MSQSPDESAVPEATAPTYPAPAEPLFAEPAATEIVPAAQPAAQAVAPTAAPGWYPQPDGSQRYFDGNQWTNHTAPGTPQAQPAQYAPAQYAPQYAVPAQSRIISDANNGAGTAVHATIAWVVCVLTLGYMLPWAIAASRGKSNSLAIGLVNFFAGWTVIGWIAALVMACSAHQKFMVQ